MPKSRSMILVEKSISAMLAAVQIFNSPMHPYREEAFAVLALNAWELLLKAKILTENKNRISSIQEYTNKTKKDGTKSLRQVIKRNRSGNPLTITLHRSIGLLDQTASTKLDPALKANLNGLIELRDNAVHFVNTSMALAKSVHELGTACLHNYALLARDWFACDLTIYNLYLMPLAFLGEAYTIDVVDLSVHESKFFKYLGALDSGAGSGDPKAFNALLRMEVKFDRTSSPDASVVRLTADATATPIYFSEERIRERYPWDYEELTKRLRSRYVDFKMNDQFHSLRRPLLKDPKYAFRRYLNPENTAGIKKDYYSQSVINVFDKSYTRR